MIKVFLDIDEKTFKRYQKEGTGIYRVVKKSWDGNQFTAQYRKVFLLPKEGKAYYYESVQSEA